MSDWTHIKAQTVALLFDVHGNYDALTAVLADLDGFQTDAIVFGGDYALFGHRPGDAVRAIRATGNPAVIGNTDEYVLDDSKGDIGHWTRQQLDEEDLAWLAELPLGLWVRPRSGAPDDESLALVHATPTDVEGTLILQQDPFEDRDLTPAEDARELMGDIRANLVVHGHIHYVQFGEVAGQRVESVGSVGFPFDGDPRAAYAMAHFRGGHWQLEHRRVEYDYEAVARAIEDSDTPLAAGRAARIRKARGVDLL